LIGGFVPLTGNACVSHQVPFGCGPSKATTAAHPTHATNSARQAVAAVIGVGESAGLLQVITENEGASLPTFFFFAMVFVVLTLPIGLWTTSLSRKLAVKR